MSKWLAAVSAGCFFSASQMPPHMGVRDAIDFGIGVFMTLVALFIAIREVIEGSAGR